MSNPADTKSMPVEAAALFTAMTEGMGLTHKSLATLFGIQSKDPLRVMRRWCDGKSPIPEVAYKAVEAMYDRLDDDVERMQKHVEAAQGRGEAPVLTAYRNSYELRDAEPAFAGLPASFHRAVLLRVWEATGAPIIYATSDNSEAGDT